MCFIVSCSNPGCSAIRKPVAIKEVEDDGHYVGVDVVYKSDGEQRYTLGVAYAANKPDVGIARDGHRDFAGPVALERAAWSYFTKSRRVGLHHADGSDGHGVVVESYVYRGPDWQIPGNDYVVKSGDWLMGVVWDEATWPDIKSGKVNGFSPQGSAKRRTPSAEAVAQLRS